MLICRWCGKQIKKTQLKITLTHNLHYDHVECSKERVKHIKERYDIDTDYTHGQKTLGGFNG